MLWLADMTIREVAAMIFSSTIRMGMRMRGLPRTSIRMLFAA
jgi:hypothetical protein